jgi:hypothetical protein
MALTPFFISGFRCACGVPPVPAKVCTCALESSGALKKRDYYTGRRLNSSTTRTVVDRVGRLESRCREPSGTKQRSHSRPVDGNDPAISGICPSGSARRTYLQARLSDVD